MNNRILLVCFAMTLTLAACDNSKHPPAISATQPRPSLPPGQIADSKYDWQGYFAGVSSIDNIPYYSEALLTEDGELRIYIDYAEPYLFAGTVEYGHDHADGTHGSGRLLRLECSGSMPPASCTEPLAAEVHLTDVTNGYLYGELSVSTPQGDEAWPLSMTWPSSTYIYAATLNRVQGNYVEWLADYSRNQDTVISVDTQGELFFQSPSTGCTGNGLLTPHLAAATSVYAASLSIGNCAADFAYLNTDFTGFATMTYADWEWADGDFLVLWLDTPGSAPAATALVMWGLRK
ncbi:MAG: hypothetical protein OEW64_11940 [Gammaproteobacteria bacterium]|nr:hypothetical protein [Gammaproteobacteria bacterium]MDH5304791.1 hypothetical protein [Gammaproteobacteria bacterium]MDH5323687.1 hypothetical protein [Gammaproteobacteria bacterium]